MCLLICEYGEIQFMIPNTYAQISRKGRRYKGLYLALDLMTGLNKDVQR